MTGKVPLLRIDDEVVSEESILPWLQKKVNEINISIVFQVGMTVSLLKSQPKLC